jgi:4-amino-4-deoxychorismate lyase
LAGLKHLNRLEQVMATQYWPDSGVAEAIMLDRDGFVVEGTMTNVFVIEGRTLVTPLIDRCGVRGVMRDLIVEAAGEWGLKASEERLSPTRLKEADAVFVTNSVIGVWPVRQFDTFPIPQPPIMNDVLETVVRLLTFRPWEYAG